MTNDESSNNTFPTFEGTFKTETPQSKKYQKDLYRDALSRCRTSLVDSNRFDGGSISMNNSDVVAALEEISINIFNRFNDELVRENKTPLWMDESEFVKKIISDILGLGPLDDLLRDPTIEDIAIDGPNSVKVLRQDKWEHLDQITFDSSERLLEILNRAIQHGGVKCNTTTPTANGNLRKNDITPDGGRVAIISYPVVEDKWPSAVIRIPRSKNLKLEDLVNAGTLTQEAANYLTAAVFAGMSITIVGSTGSGKTTLLTVLGNLLPPISFRTIIIEDTPEILIHAGVPDANVVYMRTRAGNSEGLTAVTQGDLLAMSLRFRPNSIKIGESRGPEIFDLFNASATGHDNCDTTLHSDGPDQFFSRVSMLMAMNKAAKGMPPEKIADLVAKGVDIVVDLQNRNKKRRVVSISELTGKILRSPSVEPELNKVFEFDYDQQLLIKTHDTCKGQSFIRRDIPLDKVFNGGLV